MIIVSEWSTTLQGFYRFPQGEFKASSKTTVCFLGAESVSAAHI